jgi:hypothetical protein
LVSISCCKFSKLDALPLITVHHAAFIKQLSHPKKGLTIKSQAYKACQYYKGVRAV